jgi:TIR domain
MVARIFLCHASDDTAHVREVYHRLRAIDGFEPWLGEEDLLPGQEWEREIPRALQTSDFILIFLSRTSVAKRGYVQREMKMALDVWEELPEGTIHTIPVRLDDCDVPKPFRRYHYTNLFDPRGFDRLTRAIHTGLTQRQHFTPQPILEPPLAQSSSAVKTIGLLDIENRSDPSHRLPPEQIFKIGGIRFILISGVLDQLFQRFHADIRDFLERGGQVRILLIHPELVRKSLSLNWPAHAKEWMSYWITNCNEAQIAVDVILHTELDALPGFQLRFMRELPPSLGILASDDVDPAQAGIHSFVRIQPISVGNWIGRGIVVAFRKLRDIENSPYEYFSSDLLNQWNVAIEDQRYLAQRRRALTQSK